MSADDASNLTVGAEESSVNQPAGVVPREPLVVVNRLILTFNLKVLHSRLTCHDIIITNLLKEAFSD